MRGGAGRDKVMTEGERRGKEWRGRGVGVKEEGKGGGVGEEVEVRVGISVCNFFSLIINRRAQQRHRCFRASFSHRLADHGPGKTYLNTCIYSQEESRCTEDNA